MVKLYTKTGDKGTTRLWDGTEVSKRDPHIVLNGALDETNSAIGLARALAPACMKEELNDLQDKMMRLMAYVARGKKNEPTPDPTILETWQDRIIADYPLTGKFVNPGESPSGGALHMARTIARRAEREALPLLQAGDIEAGAYQYINRLSDLLYALAHKADKEVYVERITEKVLQRALEEENTMNLSLAQSLLRVACEKANAVGCPMVLAVCDNGGNLVALERMDGALLASLSIAQSKARTAVRMQMDTKDITPLVQPGAPLYGIQNDPDYFVIVAGGRLLKKGERIIGAIGVSGGSVEQDLAVADAVVQAFEVTNK